MKTEKQKQGKKNRAAGARFELKVRADLEKQGWIVDKWSNNVELDEIPDDDGVPVQDNKLVKVKNKFLGPGKPMMLGAGFPDFIAFKGISLDEIGLTLNSKLDNGKETQFKPYVIIGVESKMNGYLDKQEKEKCAWLLKNNTFSKILIASKGTKRGQIVYLDFAERFK